MLLLETSRFINDSSIGDPSDLVAGAHYVIYINGTHLDRARISGSIQDSCYKVMMLHVTSQEKPALESTAPSTHNGSMQSFFAVLATFLFAHVFQHLDL